MSEKNWWRREKTVNADSVPVRHVIAENWGNIYISPAAEDDYGLVPLVVTTKPENEQSSAVKGIPKTRLYFGTAAEFGLPQDVDTGIALHQTRKNGTDLFIALDPGLLNSVDKIEQQMIDELKAENGFDDAVDERVLFNGLTKEEFVESQLPEVITHTIADFAGALAHRALADDLKDKSDRSFVNRATGLGAVSLVGAGVFLWANTEANGITADDFIAPTAFLAINMFMFRLRLKEYLHGSRQRSEFYDIVTEVSATTISQSVHDIFCRHVFDSKFNES